LGNNNLGNTTANWVVATYSNVRIDTRDAAPPTGPGDTGIYKITATSSSGLLIVDFYEPVYGQNNATGSIPLSAFTWQNNSPGGATSVNALDATPQNSPGTSQIRLTLNAVPLAADGDNSAPDDALALVSGQIYDATGNTGSKTRALRYGITQIATGANHTCALSYGLVRCWGNASYGIPGHGNLNDVGSGPLSIIAAGDLPVLSAAEISAGMTLTQIALNYTHACVMLSSGAMRCWGFGSFGANGNTTTLGDNAGELPVADVPVLSAAEISAGKTVTQIALGNNHTCARLSTGPMRCWGKGTNGQLGNGGTTYLGDQAGELPTADVPVFSAAEISAGRTITQIAAGEDHTCVLLSTGTMRCWGLALSGQLGYGNTINLGDNAGELPTADVPTGW
jgi:hypothetical protein